MDDGVNKEGYQSRKFACIYLWICVFRTIRQWTRESTGVVTVLAYLNISFASGAEVAAIGVERASQQQLI
jgi:hypothetical protein